MQSTVVETGAGRIRGSAQNGYVVFRGVPYAAPPLGAKRFLPPSAPEPWSGVRDALHSGPAPPQMSLPGFNWINAAAGNTDEDCLYLNVWTPAVDGARRPVMLWLHGGAFMVGAGSTPLYDGAALARRGDVVVVTINYRLGAIGFSHLGAVFPEELPESGNLGILDQLAALEWVQGNIDRFGGDPNNVTVFGQSAGGMSVGALFGAPRARGLFHRAICMSGAADHVISRSRAHLVAEKFLYELGGPSPSPTVLGRIPIERILQAQMKTMRSLVDARTLMCFLPCADGRVITQPPLEAVSAGAAADIPILTGSTLEEWKLFAPVDSGLGSFSEEDLVTRFSGVLGDMPSAPNAQDAVVQYRRALGDRKESSRERWVWNAFQSARVFHQPSVRLAEAQHRGGGRAYNYLVTWQAPAARRIIGACHAIDIPFVFGTTRHPFVQPFTGISRHARRLSRRMMDAWTGFARSGEPGHAKLPPWPAYTPERRMTMKLGRPCELAEAPFEAERQLLERWSRGQADPELVVAYAQREAHEARQAG